MAQVKSFGERIADAMIEDGLLMHRKWKNCLRFKDRKQTVSKFNH
jgi:hypothetical protein